MRGNYVDQGYQVPSFITRHWKITQDTPQVAIEILIASLVGKVISDTKE